VSFVNCPRCHKLRWDKDCRCQPYHVEYLERFGKDGKTIYGTSFEEIVETLAEAINRDEPVYEEYLFETDVTVINENGEAKKFNCIASLDVNYSVKDKTQ
jgi:hypothetical protein